MTDTEVPTQSDLDSMVGFLLRQDQDSFSQIVNDDTRHSDDEPRLSEIKIRALRDPRVVRRWYATLMSMSISVEGQLAAKTAETKSRVQHYYSIKASRRAQAEQSKFEAWKASSLRFKNGVDLRLLEAKELLWASGDRIDWITEERNAAIYRIGVLEEAIRRHRESFPSDEEPSGEDEQLWALLPPRKPNHFDPKLGES